MKFGVRNRHVMLFRFYFQSVIRVLDTHVNILFVASGFRRHADEKCALLGCNTASSGNPLPTFRDNVSVPSSRVTKSKKGYSSWTS
jgi:hypothetical protein